MDISISNFIVNGLFPFVLFFLTSCLVSLWVGVLVGAWMKQKKDVVTTIDDKKISAITPDKIVPNLRTEVSVRPAKVPKHVAVIMDGNRRFGRDRHSDSLQGHWAGGQRLIDFVQWCIEDGISMLTVYAFSTENWNRDPLEISALMNIFVEHSRRLVEEAQMRNIRVRILSTSPNKLPENVRHAVEELEALTANKTGFQLNICLSYGSREELANSCRKIASDLHSGVISDESLIDDKLLSSYLTTSAMPDPDILIRTSGEYRLSNFLLFQMAYTEMFFVNKYWPEVSQQDFRDILHRYVSRDRRFGG